jgi:hypothetical protein
MTLNELDTLKARADQMGITYKSNIGIEALKAKINAKLDDKPDPGDGDETQAAATDGQTQTAPAAAAASAPTTQAPPAAPAAPVELTKAQQEQKFRDEQQKEHMALVRVRISCLNPMKAQIKGEVITVANKYLGTVSKFVPFGEQTDDGFHIPKILLSEMRSRKFNSVTTKKGPNGQMLPTQRLVPEFAIEELEPLTQAELDRLAAAQLAESGG